MNFNTLVVRVLRAKGLQLKGGKPMDVYVSLSTVGKSNWKSKVTTNTMKTTAEGDCEWDEHCEFQLTDTDSMLQIHVNHKTSFGTTETLGLIHFDIPSMSRYQAPSWQRLTKKSNPEKDRGQLLLEYEFSNKMQTSISTFSLNKVDKENKFDKLKRKMHFGRRKSKFGDSQSMASVSLSRRSSMSSMASGLAFSSPSPNHMMLHEEEDEHTMRATASTRGTTGGAAAEDAVSQFSAHDYAIQSQQQALPASQVQMTFSPPEASPLSGKKFDEKFENVQLRHNDTDTVDRRSVNGDVTSGHGHGHSAKNLPKKMLLKAEQMFRRKNSDMNAEDVTHGGRERHTSVSSSAPHNGYVSHGAGPVSSSRPTSIASSSGFASLGSGNLATLNESTSPQYMLHVIQHLRHELQQKETRIRDLEQYVDKLVSRIIETNPEILQAP